MKNSCHAMPAAKHRPIMRRFLSNHRLNAPGNTAASDEAANAIYSHGTASLTDSWIIEETPRGLVASTLAMASKTVTDIGTVTNVNRRQPFKALVTTIASLEKIWLRASMPAAMDFHS